MNNDNVINAFFGDKRQQEQFKENCSKALREKGALCAESAERLAKAMIDEFVRMRDLSSGGLTYRFRPGMDPVESFKMDCQDFTRRIREQQGKSMWRIVYMALEEGKRAAAPAESP